MRLRAEREPRCTSVADFLPAWVAGEEELDPATLAHVARCLRCQAEVARYRRLLHALHGLRSERVEAPVGLLGAISAGLDRTPGPHRGWLIVAGVASATGALAAAGTVIWFGRRHGRAPA